MPTAAASEDVACPKIKLSPLASKEETYVSPMPQLDIIGESKPSLSTEASTCAMISVIERGGGESADALT